MLVACPRCQRTFPADEGRFCPADASVLQPVAQVAVPPDPKDPRVGTAVAGRYELRRVVADGGMGRVYEARDLQREARVALKVLHKDVAEDDVNIERFRREATTSRDLDHAHIVEVLDFATTEEPGGGRRLWYLAMEFLDGEELRAVLKRQRTVPLPRVLRVVSQLALGLDPAHRRGVVHRDLKPDNVFLVRKHDGDLVKILDFGSVKFTKGQDRGNKLTVLGTTIGSPYYMSPEQAQGSPDLDHRADVWAVGVMIYEMCVGRVPFLATNGPQILFKILGDEPEPPTFVNESLPAALDNVVLRALHKKPPQRYDTCGALADALGSALGLSGDHRAWAEQSELDLQLALDGATARAGSQSPAEPAARQSLGGTAEPPSPPPSSSALSSEEGPAPPRPVLSERPVLPVRPALSPWAIVVAAAVLGFAVIMAVSALVLR
jgi:serine/threonine-protein kinase